MQYRLVICSIPPALVVRDSEFETDIKWSWHIMPVLIFRCDNNVLIWTMETIVFFLKKSMQIDSIYTWFAIAGTLI